MKTAYTHLAASRIGGKTLHHFIQKHKTFRGTLVIDEASQVPLTLWSQLLGYLHSKVQFIVCGDFISQFQPAYNQWRLNGEVQESFAETDALRSLCDRNRVTFTTYHRGNSDLYDFWKGLIGLPAKDAVALARARFPSLPDAPRWQLTVSNAHRKALLKQSTTPGELVQTFDGEHVVGLGSRLVGRIQGDGVVNGLFFTVVATDLLRDEMGRELKVNDYSKFAVADALVYYSSQGRTLDGRVRLHVGSPHLTTTALIVGLQRCTHSSLIDVV